MKKVCLCVCVAVMMAISSVRAEFHPVDLGEFVGPSGFDAMEAQLAIPVGDQIIAGIPYRIDGLVQLDGGGPRAAGQNYPTEVGPIPVDTTFSQLRLLGGAAWSCPEGEALAVIELAYEDGTRSELPVRFGHHVRDHYGERYKVDAPMLDARARVTWREEHWDPGRWDKQLRFFESTHENPSPNRKVTAIRLRSTGTNASLMIMGIAVGTPGGEALASTWSFAPELEPDDSDARSGDTVDITGRVLNRDGEPLPDVEVIVLSARNFGTYTSNASFDHPALGRSTKTDAEGRYQIEGLTNDRIYQIAYMEDGHETRVHGGVDPVRGPGIVWLKTAGPRETKPFEIRARLVDAAGNPISGAIITPDGVKYARGIRWGGNNGFPEWSVSDQDGFFSMGRDEQFDELQLKIRAPGFAPEHPWLSVSDEVHEVILGKGSQIWGRLLKNGSPLAGIRVGISGQQRSSQVYAGHYETTTNAEGRFEFNHVKPNTAWWLYGIIGSLGEHGALPPMAVQSTEHGHRVDLGDLSVSEGQKMIGRVVTADGSAVPSDFLLTVGNDKAWDSVRPTLDEEGAFVVEGLYAERLDVSVAMRNWRLTARNRSLDTWNPFRLSGLFEREHAEIVIEIEPGQSDYNSPNSNGQLPQQDQSRNRPLRGIEKTGGTFIRAIGSVVDEDTGEPIEAFTILPGRKPPVMPTAATPAGASSFIKTLTKPFRDEPTPWNERIWWDHSRQQIAESGRFDFEFEVLTSTPLVQITAQGYEPFTSDLIVLSTNMTVRLERGRGPNGIVVFPDGRPAAGAKIVYAAGREQFGLEKDGTISTHRIKPENSAYIGESGTFAFSPRPDGKALFASHKEGWALVDADDYRDGGKIRLKKWAGVKGTLVDKDGNPVVGEDLNVSMSDRMRRDEPFVNVQGRVTTDDQGRFQINGIPPEPMELVRLISTNFGGGSVGWTHKLQAYIHPDPGEVEDLGRIVMDQPPPPPLTERVKQKLGL